MGNGVLRKQNGHPLEISASHTIQAREVALKVESPQPSSHRNAPARRKGTGTYATRLGKKLTLLAVLLGSVSAAILASIVLRTRNRVYRRLEILESRDDDGDGVPDCFEVTDVEQGERG